MYVKNNSMKPLVGQKVYLALIAPTKDVVILATESGPFYLTWGGDCCAKCFLGGVSGAEALVGSTILGVEHSEWVSALNISGDYYDDVVESMGTKIKTDKGYVTLETRLEHNGYYGGWILVSRERPEMDIFNSPDLVPPGFSMLKDF